MMRFYNQQHRFYCGLDLHARTLSLCLLDAQGAVVHHDTHPATGRDFLATVAPFRDGLVVACECLFAWYWLADLCSREQIPFVLGHAFSAGEDRTSRTWDLDKGAERLALAGHAGTVHAVAISPDGARVVSGSADRT